MMARQRPILIAASIFFVLIVLISIYQWPQVGREYFPKWHPDLSGSTEATRKEELKGGTEEKLVGLDLLPEYKPETHDTPYCEDRYGRKYLDGFQKAITSYCSPGDASSLTCFHGNKWPDNQRDSLCFGSSAVFDQTDKKFRLGCNLRDLDETERLEGIPQFGQLRSYWYETGPKLVFEKAVKLEAKSETLAPATNYTILLKREGAYNIWHCLLEIWSMTMTLDVLRSSSHPLFSTADADNTQIVILDEQDDGPYIDLWKIFAKRPIVRVNNIAEGTNFENIIVPLAGASNPLWQGDWEPHACDHSELLRVFTHRVLDFYQIDTTIPHDGDIVLTFIDRKESRHLQDSDAYLKELKEKIPHLKVQIVDFTAITFAEQLQFVRGTDVLVGVHGAGLTHGMFMKKGSVMIEMLPPTLNHKGFRNLANILGHTYLSTHGGQVDGQSGGDWHGNDIALSKERFMNLIEIGVKTMYNKGQRNFDVN